MARADDGHAALLSLSGKPFGLTFILLSSMVRFLALNQIKPQHPLLVCFPAKSGERSPKIIRHFLVHLIAFVYLGALFQFL